MWSGETCAKCKRRMNVTFSVPPEVWRTVVLNRWRVLCPQCFDLEAEKAGVKYAFENLEGTTRSDETARAAERSRSRRS